MPCHKTWCVNFFVLVREVKNSRATTKKFSRHFVQKTRATIRSFAVRISDKTDPD
ncbi:DUF1661 domain-containing protein [Porphyromonas gingivalis]|nr:DUF1661 domain-containing protein [Porphyromonas gingivalis]MCE8188919.1 DUF1661 domain-containing protein [Porphyromonas gingivalis]RRG14128.1 DUF1661 domain-containing protein [Porphyromonas gingivalis]